MLYTFVTICVFVGVNVFNLHLVMLNLPAFVHRIKLPKTLGHHHHHHDNSDNSDKNSSHYSWLDRLPYYYRFLLNESQVLIFNNAKCVHKFVNQGVPFPGAEQIYTLRLFSTDPDMTALRNDIFHWRQAQEYAHILMHSTLLRQIGDVTGHQLGQQLGYH